MLFWYYVYPYLLLFLQKVLNILVNLFFEFNTYLCTACVSRVFHISAITYLLVYRTDKYKKLKAEVEKHSKKCKLCNIPS
jgi:predicted CDP-diglyceride synthetase/phosphatidate cytidylyltransferase